MKTILLSIVSVTRPARRFHALCLAAGFALAGAGAHAQLISSESFASYTVGPKVPNILPSPTVPGYTGNWTNVDFGTQWPTVIAGSLSYTGSGYAASSGNHIGVPNNTSGGEITAANSGRMYRVLNSSLAVTASTTGTRYMSWLFQSGQETGNTTYQMLELYNGSTADAARTFAAGLNYVASIGNQYDFQVNSASVDTTTGVNADTAVHLFVVKFNLSATAASDSVTVWIDPTLGAGEPAGGITVSGKDFVFDRLSISDYDGNSANWGDIRWGSTFDSVTIVTPPVPPTVAAVANPSAASINQSFAITATVTPNAGTVTNVTVDLSQIGGSAAASLVLSNANVYTNIFTVPGTATIGVKTLTVLATDTTPLGGSAAIAFTVLPNSRTWNGGSVLDSKWSSVTNWVLNAPPTTSADSVTFAGTTRLTPDMNGSYSIAGLSFDNTAGSFNIGSSTGGALTNGLSGIVNNSANAQVLNVPVVLGVAQTFNANTGNLTLSNSVTGGLDLIKAGAGTLAFASTGGSSSVGNLVVSNGLLKVVSGSLNVAATQGNSKVDTGSTLEVSGGTFSVASANNAWFPIGDTAATTSTLTLSGGSVIITNNWGIQIGRNGSGVLNVNSGSLYVRDTGVGGVSIAESASESGTVNLNGGNLTMVRVRGATGTGYFYFNGGTLSPTESRADFFPNMPAVTTSVRNGGAIVDTAGFGVEIADYLEHSALGGDNAIDGGLTKTGNGTLTLSGGYAYTGPTKVLGGTLKLNPSLGVPAAGGDLMVSNGMLIVDASSGSALPAANVIVKSGATLNLTNNPGANAINATGNLTLSGGTTLNLDYGVLGGNPTVAAINVAGSFSSSGANVINIIATGTVTVGQFPLIDYTGTAVPTNGFVLGLLPAGVSAVLTNNADNTSLDLLISLIGNSLSWHGANADNSVLLTNWDINTSANWYDAAMSPTVYMQYNGNTIGDKVTFGDNGYNLDGTNAVNLSGRVVPATVNINSGTPYRLTGTGGIDGSTALIVDNAGSFLIGTSNNYTGGTVITAGTLAIANNSALGSGAVTLSGGTLQLAVNFTNVSPVTVTSASTVETPTGVSGQMSGAITGTASLAQIGGGALTLAGNVAVAGLTKSDNGILTLTGSNSINGNLTLNAGTVNIPAGSTTITGGGNPNFTMGSSGAKAVLQLSGTASLTSPSTGKFVRLGTQGGIGIMSNGPNSLLSFNQYGIGFGNTGAGSAGAIYNSGVFTNLSGSYLGNDDNTYGYFRNAGTAYFGDNVLITHNDVTSVNGGAAVLDVIGGNVTKTGTGTFWLNDQNQTYSGAAANAGLNITGGTLTFTGNGYQWNINNGMNDYASVNVTGSGVITMTGNAGFGLGRSNNAANVETFTLANGGTFQGGYVFTTAAASSPVFTFNNGIYRATATNTDGSIQPGILAYIQSGGAVFDTAGNNTKIPVALLAPTGNGVTGIVLGGTTSGYIGAPVVKIVGDGVGAAAVAGFDPITGTITGITITSPGSGYTTATVTLEGGSGTPGNGATGGTATATAQLGPVSSGGLTKTGNGTLALNGTNTYTGPTVVQAGTLGGTGIIAGALTNNATLAPGDGGIGALTVNGNLTFNAGSTNLFDVNGTTLSNDVVVAGGAVKYGGELRIAPAGTFTNGQQFVLFSGAGAANAGNFASLQGSPGGGLGFTFTNGVLSVVATTATYPTNITATVNGSSLEITWPATHLGWMVEVQTNTLNVGLSNNWITISNTAAQLGYTNAFNPVNGSEFYRLRSP